MEAASLDHAARVLIVDDEIEHAEICALLLRRRGYDVAVAPTGRDAVELAQLLKPDLILLDLFMPSLDGIATATSLQEQPDTRNVPIVFLSACGDVALRDQAIAVAGADYLPKPFHASELIACVERSLARPR